MTRSSLHYWRLLVCLWTYVSDDLGCMQWKIQWKGLESAVLGTCYSSAELGCWPRDWGCACGCDRYVATFCRPPQNGSTMLNLLKVLIVTSHIAARRRHSVSGVCGHWHDSMESATNFWHTVACVQLSYVIVSQRASASQSR